MSEIARELIKLAKRIISGDEIDKFMQWYKRGDWKYCAYFLGKKKRGKRPKKIVDLTKFPPLKEDDIRQMVKEFIQLKLTDDALIFSFYGTQNRPDTYVFTKEPYTEVFPDSSPPKKTTEEQRIRIQVGLREEGLINLGSRAGKHGEYYGKPGLARRIRIGARDMVFNMFQVTISRDDHLRRPQDSWVMHDIINLKKVDDRLIKVAAKWVKQADTMKEVRDRARKEYQQKNDDVVELG
jgi:hypothetical protein